MRTIIELDEHDITEAIAEKFGCDKGQVSVTAERITRGYGMSERDCYVVCARIDKSKPVSNMPVLNGSAEDVLVAKIDEQTWSDCRVNGIATLDGTITKMN